MSQDPSADYRATLAARADAEERPLLRAAGLRALAEEPCPESLYALACAAAGLADLDEAQRARALEHIRFGLAAEGPLQWEAVHLAGELELPDALEELGQSLVEIAANTQLPAATRARAVEGIAELADEGSVGPFFEQLRTGDASWTVRRAAKDAAHRVAIQSSLRGRLFGRFAALLRCDRLRLDPGDEPLEPRALALLGLRHPPAQLLFLLAHFGGGRLIHLELSPKDEPADRESVNLSSPRALHKTGARPARRAADLSNFDEYVYARYIDGGSSYPQVDEAYAVGRYAEHYAGGVIDEEAYNYGVLCFERAFSAETERERETLLLRTRDLLRTYADRSGEAWDALDDRREEAEELLQEESLRWPTHPAPRTPLVIGDWSGVAELALDLEGQGVFARETTEAGEWWQIAPSASAFLNGLALPPRVKVVEVAPLTLIEETAALIAAGQRRKAARTFADALERDRKSAPMLRAVGELLDGLEPMEAAQLLAAILLAGDRPSSESVKAALQASGPDHVLAMVEAVADYDEDGSQIALLIDCAAALRKKSHSAARLLAKERRDGRGALQIRTIRNPFYN